MAQRRRRMEQGQFRLPEASWLFGHGPHFRQQTDGHPKRCSWCNNEFIKIPEHWFACPQCDTAKPKPTEGDKQ